MSTNKYKDFDKEIRMLIIRESDIVNNRMNYLIVLNGLLFAGFYKIYKEDLCMAGFVSIIGIAIAIVIKRSFWSNEKAIAFILEKWNSYIRENNLNVDNFPPVWCACYNEILKDNKDIFIYKKLKSFETHKALPNIFIFIWLFNLAFCFIKWCITI